MDDLSPPTAEQSATIAWLNAVCAAYTLDHSGGDFLHFGGGRRTAGYVRDIANYLENDWGVTDETTADELLQWLFDYGQRGDYIRAAKQLEARGFLELTDDEFMARIEDEYMYDHTTAGAWLNVAHIYKEHGEYAVDAWNSALYIRLASFAYVAGYFSYEKAVELSVKAGQELQQNYSSWDAMMESYLLGYSFFLGRSMTESKDQTPFSVYERLKKRKGNPFLAAEWNTPLEPVVLAGE